MEALKIFEFNSTKFTFFMIMSVYKFNFINYFRKITNKI